jgi:hypothetical protein
MAERLRERSESVAVDVFPPSSSWWRSSASESMTSSLRGGRGGGRASASELAARIEAGSTVERTWRREETVRVVLVWTLSSVLGERASCGCSRRSWTRRGVGRPPEVVR